ncbi:MAG TPA: ABC-type transport auxiliary lipoprotein family protein [Desulfomicrobiaceae bacterium]|nr:ABC-type transport auxiliary lipoprotein family protein [Desulfomicrobiaceae bacterium]
MPRNFPLILICLLLLAGCSSGRPGRPDLTVHSYTLDYPAPAREPRITDRVLTILPFTTAPEYDQRRIVYAPGPGELAAYHYHQWRVTPAELVQSFLRRDLARSNLFAAVTGPDTVLTRDLLLEGSVDEFLERDGRKSWSAAVTVTVALIDGTKKDAVRRLLFQRTYTETEPCTARTPKGVAEAISRAVGRVSKGIRLDIRNEITPRVPPRVP